MCQIFVALAVCCTSLCFSLLMLSKYFVVSISFKLFLFFKRKLRTNLSGWTRGRGRGRKTFGLSRPGLRHSASNFKISKIFNIKFYDKDMRKVFSSHHSSALVPYLQCYNMPSLISKVSKFQISKYLTKYFLTSLLETCFFSAVNIQRSYLSALQTVCYSMPPLISKCSKSQILKNITKIFYD